MTRTSIRAAALFFFRPYAAVLGATVLMMVVSAAADAASIALLLPVSRELLGVRQSAPGLLDRLLAVAIDPWPFESPLLRSLAAFATATVLAEGTKLATVALAAGFACRARAEVGTSMFEHVLEADVRRVITRPQGDWLHRIVMAPFQMTTLFTLTPLLAVQVLRVVTVMVVLLAVSPLLAGVAALVGGAFYAFTRRLGRRHLFELGVKQVGASDAQTAVAAESLASFREIRLYDVAAYWVARFARATESYTVNAVRQARLSLLAPNLLGIVVVTLVCVSLMMLQAAAGQGYIAVLPTATLFVAAFGRTVTELATLGRYQMQIVGMLPFAVIVREELEIPQRPDRQHPDRQRPDRQGAAIADQIGEVVVDRVSYTHPGRDRTLDDVSLTFRAGELSVIVGESGSGKSTLIDLLMGFFPPDTGSIAIDGANLNTLDLRGWHSRVGYVGQVPFLFHASVAENVAIGRGLAAGAAADAMRAARVDVSAGTANDRVTGDRGGLLSGGERQRVAVARALAGRPAVLLLDEVTSQLDPELELALLRDVRAATAGRIVILVSHRPAAAAAADQVIRIDRGRVVEVVRQEAFV